MKLVFSGLETPIELTPGIVSTLQVENQALFTRIVRSLMNPEGGMALEPYSLWSGNSELRPSGSLMLVQTPVQLPWDDRALIGEVAKRFERELLEDEDLRRSIEEMDAALSAKLLELGFGMNSDYAFGLEWDVKRYLKFKGFGVGRQESQTLLDSLIDFLSLTLDAGCKKVITFVNLKTFLTKNELKALFEHVFYSKISVLLLENIRDEMVYDYEHKITVDLHFLES